LLNKNKAIDILTNKPINEICTNYIFIEMLYNLFEKGKACSIEAQEDFLEVYQEEVNKIDNNKEINYEKFLKLKKLIEQNDFDKENLALDIYNQFEFIQHVYQKAFESCDFYFIFKLRFFLNYFYKILQNKCIYDDKFILTQGQNIKDSNSKVNIIDINKDSDDDVENNKIIDNLSFKNKKIIYSRNEFFKNLTIEKLFNSKGSIILSNNFITCCNKKNLNKLLDGEIFNNDRKNIIKDKKSLEDIIICSYFLDTTKVSNDANLNFEKQKNDAQKQNNISFEKKDENDSNNSRSIVNNSMINNSYQNSYLYKKMNLNFKRNEIQNVFNLGNKLNNINNNLANKSKTKIEEANSISQNMNFIDFPYLIRNNIFLIITDIINKKYTCLKEKTQELNTIPESLNFDYFEVIFEFQKYDKLPALYKMFIKKLSQKLEHILFLEYDNDYLYLFDIMQGLDLNEKLVEIIENIIAKSQNLKEDNIHSLEDKKFFLAQNLYYLGEAYFKVNEFNKAIKKHEESLLLKKEILREDHPEYVLSLNNLSSLYFSQENFEQALKLYEECMKIEEAYLTEKMHPNLGITYNNIATVQNKNNKFDEALKFYFKSLEIEKYCYGEKSIEVASTLNNIGIVYDNLGDFNKAFQYYRDGLKIREEISEDDDIDLGNCYNNLAVALDNDGKFEEAMENYDKSINILLKHCNKEHPDVIAVMNNIANLKEKIKGNKD